MRSNMLLSLALGLLAADSVLGGLCKLQTSSSTLVFTKPGFPAPDPPTPTIGPTTTSTTSIASTTTSETAVSSSSAVRPPPVDPGFTPFANFMIVAGGGPDSPTAGSVLQSNGQNTRSVMFHPVEAGLVPITLTIEAGTGHLIQSNGMYLCARYSFRPNYPSMLINCATEGVWTTYRILSLPVSRRPIASLCAVCRLSPAHNTIPRMSSSRPVYIPLAHLISSIQASTLCGGILYIWARAAISGLSRLVCVISALLDMALGAVMQLEITSGTAGGSVANNAQTLCQQSPMVGD
ncbi:hypothetical protein BGZ61DRAFT_482719 [Ilyonectria robusta]|uniref:uncharacterized protein n=1 Tax=Ilyonectria robusta TaxID=1079257 RepID=UPI001E8EA8BB|nr:uncharacterized protein BGZ61DRAFT_482719 [Ilyonectria robusta]KAH8672384.1 hypothetical protein BGZ61DRAFT_482719 [Ilyonectria robusta]